MNRSSSHRLAAAIAMAMACIAIPARPASAAQLSSATAHAYDGYIRAAESRMQGDYALQGAFLWPDAHPQSLAQRGALAKGQVLITCVAGCDSGGVPVSGGLIHDWLGITFVPGISLPQALAVVQDYDHAKDHYAPGVTASRLISHSGDRWKVFLRLKQTGVLTVVFDTEYDIRYANLDALRVYSVSHSTRIARVEDAGKPRERELPPGKDQGFLWRLDSYWRFEQVDGGVYIQCEAISLTRDVPAGLGWLVKPFLKDIPRNSLQFTLAATRKALLSKAAGARP
ncbi:MAG TPA: hypothetical protein VN661_10075 [Candidatus Acidoferrales bacterium]|nr:hypothetical protein [Candidatus Acidoferrales bacterium]